MKTKTKLQTLKCNLSHMVMVVVLICISATEVVSAQTTNSNSYIECKGTVVDAKTKDPLVFASVNVLGTNISMVCNSEGVFLIKVPVDLKDGKLRISFLGYKSKDLNMSDVVDKENLVIALEGVSVALSEVNVLPKDPNLLIKTVLKNQTLNYPETEFLMPAFYRETIKKGRSYVSISESVVEIYKQSYTNSKSDLVRIIKGRKSTDYNKLDTLALKLMGGPYSTLLIDVMKNPDLIFSLDLIDKYEFKLANITRINDRLVYILDFKQKAHVDEPLYYGSLYIDAETMAISSASFNLNVYDRVKAAEMMIHKKPYSADVYPLKASYLVSYTLKDGKWFYAYSRGQIDFKVDWKRKLINSTYYTTIELAATDRKIADVKNFSAVDKLKYNVVMEDAVSGFSDPDFWGVQNVIEPEQSIEVAIRKIQKQLEK